MASYRPLYNLIELPQICRWWLAPDPSSNHYDAVKKRGPETGLWFINGVVEELERQRIHPVVQHLYALIIYQMQLLTIINSQLREIGFMVG